MFESRGSSIILFREEDGNPVKWTQKKVTGEGTGIPNKNPDRACAFQTAAVGIFRFIQRRRLFRSKLSGSITHFGMLQTTLEEILELIYVACINRFADHLIFGRHQYV